jgi:ubiquitin-like protein Nedd8
MKINVRTVSGRSRSIEVEPNMTIGAIKEEMQQMEGIPPTMQRLLFQGQNLSDMSTIESAHIVDGSVVHMVLALRAGF